MFLYVALVSKLYVRTKTKKKSPNKNPKTNPKPEQTPPPKTSHPNPQEIIYLISPPMQLLQYLHRCCRPHRSVLYGRIYVEATLKAIEMQPGRAMGADKILHNERTKGLKIGA